MKMAEEAEDENILKRLIESIASSRASNDGSTSQEHSDSVTENVAQLLAAALSQASDTGDEYNPIDNVDNTIEVPSSIDRHKNLGIKFSPDIRRKIINYRKGGKRYRDIAKELGASVSGVQKVWERFLSTGTIGDKKPLVSAGRPRKYGKQEHDSPSVEMISVDDSYIDTVQSSSKFICN